MNFSVVIPYRWSSGRARLFYWVEAWWEYHFPEAQICIGNNEDVAFNRSKARNRGVALARHDLVVMADADTVPNPVAVQEALELVESSQVPWALPYADGRYYNLSFDATERFVSGSPRITVPEPGTVDVEHKLTSVAGCLVFCRAAWAEVHGYDERFKGWGGEDVAFAHSLDVVAGRHHRCGSYVVHLWHPVSVRTTFDGPQWPSNGDLQRRYQAAQTPRQVMDVRG